MDIEITEKRIKRLMEAEKKKLDIEENVKLCGGWAIYVPHIIKREEYYAIFIPSHREKTRKNLLTTIRHELYHLYRHKKEIDGGVSRIRNYLLDITAEIYAWLKIKL